MEDKSEFLYRFHLSLDEDLNQPMPYRLTVHFSGNPDFYEKLLSVAKSDRVLLTYRYLPFFKRLIYHEKTLLYLEQQTNKKSKYTQWVLEDILKNEKDTLIFYNKEILNDIRNKLPNLLNAFAREVASKKYKKK